MQIIDNFIFNSSWELVPRHTISPFDKSYVEINRSLSINYSVEAENYFESRFGFYTLMQGGRSAMNKAFQYYNLKPEDTVSILTTSENFYISGCVTKEIEKWCKWSRKIESSTKLIFVNHEFGYPYENISELKKYGLPIIEDCAHSFYSTDIKGEIGTIGDFVIYSLPKAFPIQMGGVLVNNLGLTVESDLDANLKKYVLKVIGSQIGLIDSNIMRRLDNHKYLAAKLSQIDCSPLFANTSGVVPGVYLFKTPSNLDVVAMKVYLQSNGIESSIFYGKKAYFIPVHQNLTQTDMDYFVSLIKSFVTQ